MIKFDLPTSSISGRFKVEMRDAFGQKTYESAWIPNLITNSGLDALNSGLSLFRAPRLVFGTGNTPPSYGDTTLVNGVALSTGSRVVAYTTNSGAPDYIVKSALTFTNTLGSIVGNISEIGITFSTSDPATAIVRTRALLRDSSGNPITISVTSGDQLIVTYELTSIPNLTPITGTFNLVNKQGGNIIDVTSVGYTARLVRVAGNLNSDLCSGIGYTTVTSGVSYNLLPTDIAASESSTPISITATTSPVVGSNVAGSTTTKPYVNGSFTSGATSTWTINQANFASGINSFTCYGGTVTANIRYWQIILDQPIMKTSNHTLTVDVDCSIGRA